MRQKFLTGYRVRIATDLGDTMSHFESDCEAIVNYTYAQKYGGSSYDEYSLGLIDPETGKIWNTSAWYYESQLSLIDDDMIKGMEMLEEFNLRTC